MNEKLNSSVLPLVALSVVLSMAAIITVAARWPGQQTTMMAVRPVAAVRHAAPLQTVHVVMHDPGCHWFQVAGKFTRSLTVKGPIKLTNSDEAALNVVGSAGTKRDAVGGGLRLGAGTYRITMVNQASDDNHLKLVVN